MSTPDSEGIAEGIRRELRVVGLRGFSTPSLEMVERRRLQLWVLTTFLLLSVSLAVVALSVWPSAQQSWLLPSPVLHVSIVLMALAFCTYAIEKEMHLHRLSRLLTDERVLSTALTNRLHEVSLLLEAGKAINSVLDLPAVLDTILRSATELLGGASGSIMLVEGDELVTECFQGDETARNSRVRIGEGIAGRVAESREPLLVDGKVDSERFPGWTRRRSKVESAVSTPLVSRDEVVGVLNVNAGAERTFTEYDLRAMSVFAEQAAAAISNARMYEAERQHVLELIRVDRLKSEFVALVTHELRTPITSILGAIKTAQQLETAGEREVMNDIVERQAKRLDGMVEELLAAARLERSDSPPRTEVIDVASLARIVASDLAVSGLEVELDAPASAMIVGDPEWVRRILDNLLDNAWKYGTPPVRIEVEAGKKIVVVSVLDHGPGIPDTEREEVFERFQRLGHNASQPGLGLGLPIVRGLVRALGGDVWIEETLGGGAAFRVSMVAAQSEQEGV